MKKRLFAGFLMIVFSAVFMYAAGKQDVQKKGAEKKAVTMRVLCVYTPDHSVGPAVTKINALYKKSHPEVTIEMQTMAGDQMKQILRNDFEAGNPPAVFNIWKDYTNLDFIKSNKWYNFKDALAKDPAWANNFLAGALDLHKYGTDGIWGVPQAAFTLGIFYNEDLFKTAGIAVPPATMADFYTAVDKLKALKGITPMPIGNTDAWRARHLFEMLFYKLNGCNAAEKLAERKIPYDGPQVIKAFEEMQRMAKSGCFGSMYQGLGYSDEVSLFNEGKSGMRFSGSWTTGEVKNVKTDFIPFPYYKDRPQYKGDWFAGYADGWGIAAGLSPALQKAALDYVKLWTSPAGFKIFAEVAKNIPAGKADIDSSITGALFAKVVSEMKEAKRTMPDFPERSSKVTSQIQTAAQAVLALQLSPKKAAEMIQKAVKESE